MLYRNRIGVLLLVSDVCRSTVDALNYVYLFFLIEKQFGDAHFGGEPMNVLVDTSTNIALNYFLDLYLLLPT